MSGYKGGKYNILVTVYSAENAEDIKAYMKDKRNKVMTGEEIKKKGSSQRGLGSNMPAHLNDSPFYEEETPLLTILYHKKSDLSTDSSKKFKEAENALLWTPTICLQRSYRRLSLKIDGEGDDFHTTVTVFEPDVVRNGLPFDYTEYLLENDSNFELNLEITKENSESEAAIRQTEATAPKKEFSKDSVPDSEQKSNTFSENSSKISESEVKNDSASCAGRVVNLIYRNRRYSFIICFVCPVFFSVFITIYLPNFNS